MAAPVIKDELRAEIQELTEQREALDAEWEGKRFDQATKDRFNYLTEQKREKEAILREIDLREKVIAEDAKAGNRAEDGVQFYTPKPGKTDNIWDLSDVRRSYDDPGVEEKELHDRALRAIEMTHFPHPVAERRREDVQGNIEHLLGDGESRKGSEVAKYLLYTGSPEYKRAFTKYLQGAPRTQGEETLLYRAMSLTTTSGGFAVPFVLDTALIPTSNGAVNPYRQIGNVETISVDEWRGVSSGGITAAFQAEAAATTDQSPTLAQPTVSTEMGRVNIPYSIEIGMDWGDFAGSMAADIQDSKDVLEATKFAVGSGTNEPFGVITGATTVFTSSSTNVLFVADIYGVHNALGPRFRNGATWTFNNAILDKVRQLDTAGGSAMLQSNIQLRSAAQVASMTDGRAGVDIFGHPVYEASGQSAAMTTGQLIGVVGDYGRYYKIVDRVGLNVEVIPHLTDATTGMPTGQRALFAYWRTGAKVLAAGAFRTLKLA
jgi:HK97 family phage major capsid protein